MGTLVGHEDSSEKKGTLVGQWGWNNGDRGGRMGSRWKSESSILRMGTLVG